MTAQTYIFPSCDKGTSTPVIDIQFVNVVDGLDVPIDMREVPLVLTFNAPGCPHAPAFVLSTENGKITAPDGENGWIRIASFLANYDRHTYTYTSAFTFPDDVVLGYIKGTFPIT